MNYITYVLFSFIIGSIPFALIITKILFEKDVRDYADKNPGATNAFRAAGAKAGVPSLLFEIGKGYIVVYVAQLYDFPLLLIMIGAFSAILGHAYSVFLKFKGGKSIAVSMGALFGIYGIIMPIFFAIGAFIGIIIYKKDVHSTVVGIWSMPIGAIILHYAFINILFLGSLAVFLTYRQIRTTPLDMDIIKSGIEAYKSFRSSNR